MTLFQLSAGADLSALERQEKLMAWLSTQEEFSRNFTVFTEDTRNHPLEDALAPPSGYSLAASKDLSVRNWP